MGARAEAKSIAKECIQDAKVLLEIGDSRDPRVVALAAALINARTSYNAVEQIHG